MTTIAESRESGADCTAATPMPHLIAPRLAEIGSLCRRYSVRRMALFGSVLRSDFMPASDVDIVVEFDPGCTPGLSFFTLQRSLSELLEAPPKSPTLLSKGGDHRHTVEYSNSVVFLLE